MHIRHRFYSPPNLYGIVNAFIRMIKNDARSLMSPMCDTPPENAGNIKTYLQSKNAFTLNTNSPANAS